MVVLSPMRHVSANMDLTEDELKELNTLMVHCKKAIQMTFDCDKIAYMFYEKPNGHIHFVIIPLHGLVEIQDKYSVLGELMSKAKILRSNEKNMAQVTTTIKKFREYFEQFYC